MTIFGPTITINCQTRQKIERLLTKEEEATRLAEIAANEAEEKQQKREGAETAYIEATKNRQIAEQERDAGNLDQAAVDRYLAIEVQRKQELDNTPSPVP